MVLSNQCVRCACSLGVLAAILFASAWSLAQTTPISPICKDAPLSETRIQRAFLTDPITARMYMEMFKSCPVELVLTEDGIVRYIVCGDLVYMEECAVDNGTCTCKSATVWQGETCEFSEQSVYQFAWRLNERIHAVYRNLQGGIDRNTGRSTRTAERLMRRLHAVSMRQHEIVRDLLRRRSILDRPAYGTCAVGAAPNIDRLAHALTDIEQDIEHIDILVQFYHQRPTHVSLND